MDAEHEGKQLLTPVEVAKRLRVSLQTVYLWLRSGELEGYQLSERKSPWRISETQLQAFLEARLASKREQRQEQLRRRRERRAVAAS